MFCHYQTSQPRLFPSVASLIALLRSSPPPRCALFPRLTQTSKGAPFRLIIFDLPLPFQRREDSHSHRPAPTHRSNMSGFRLRSARPSTTEEWTTRHITAAAHSYLCCAAAKFGSCRAGCLTPTPAMRLAGSSHSSSALPLIRAAQSAPGGLRWVACLDLWTASGVLLLGRGVGWPGRVPDGPKEEVDRL